MIHRIDTSDGTWRETDDFGAAQLVLYDEQGAEPLRKWVRDEPMPPLPTEDERWAAGFGRGYHTAAAIFFGPPLPQGAVEAITEQVRRETVKAVLDRMRAEAGPTGQVSVEGIAREFEVSE